jgi:hypothetical protein
MRFLYILLLSLVLNARADIAKCDGLEQRC